MPRKPVKLTPERRDEIDRAMESANGVKNTAAGILGTTPVTLARWIKNDRTLSLKWNGAEEYDDTHRPLTLSGEEKKAISLAKEEKSLIRGFRELGFSDDEVETLSAISQFTNGKMDQVIDFTYGGMVHNAAKLQGLFSSTLKKHAEVAANPEDYHEYGENGNITYSGWKKLKELSNGLLEIEKEIRNTNTAAEQAMIQRAKIDEIRRRQLEDMKGPPKKPGFGGPPEVYGNPHLTQNNYYDGNKTKEAEKDA